MSEASGTVRIDTTSYEIAEGRTPEFASIELKFQDTERNLFQQTFTFNIFRHEASKYLSVASASADVAVMGRAGYTSDSLRRLQR